MRSTRVGRVVRGLWGPCMSNGNAAPRGAKQALQTERSVRGAAHQNPQGHHGHVEKRKQKTGRWAVRVSRGAAGRAQHTRLGLSGCVSGGECAPARRHSERFCAKSRLTGALRCGQNVWTSSHHCGGAGLRARSTIGVGRGAAAQAVVGCQGGGGAQSRQLQVGEVGGGGQQPVQVSTWEVVSMQEVLLSRQRCCSQLLVRRAGMQGQQRCARHAERQQFASRCRRCRSGGGRGRGSRQ